MHVFFFSNFVDFINNYIFYLIISYKLIYNFSHFTMMLASILQAKRHVQNFYSKIFSLYLRFLHLQNLLV